MGNVLISQATLVSTAGIRQAALRLCDGQVAPWRNGKEVLELKLPDHLIFPGLINAHDHLQLNSIPPLPREAGPFPNSYAWSEAFQAHRERPAVAAAIAVPGEQRLHHGGLKNLLSGATTVQHHDPWHVALAEPGFPVRVPRNFGWSHSLRLGVGAAGTPPPYGPPVLESFAATRPGEPWIIHLAEGTDALAAEELSRLDELGCLASNTVLVHGVGLTASDLDLLIGRGAGVIWCPGSNLAILGRTLDPRRLFEAGRLALGSDSRLSGAWDLLAELRVAAEHSDLTARELLRLVTEDAARMLRIPLAGGLAAGQHADLLILRDRGGDPYGQLLAARRADLCAVVRNAVPALADPEFADWFIACGAKAVRVRLDGRDKLLSSHCMPRGAGAAAIEEPGLEVRAAS